MNLSRFSVRRPVATMMCVLTLIVFGISSVFDMEMESTPEMSMPVFMVMTRYENATPEEVDQLVTDPVESALSSVSDVETMTSRSSEGSSMTTLEFNYGVDMDEKYDEIEDALEMVRLPEDADDPTIMEMSMDSSSIMDLSIQTSSSDGNIYSYIENTVVPQLENISGVASVEMRGGTREYIRVTLREEDMDQYGVTMTDVANAISTADFTVSAGEIGRGSTDISLQGGQSLDSYEDIPSIPISLASGDIIHVSDVADVELASEETSMISKYNGMENISMTSLIGLVMLVGIVVNNAIVLIDYTNILCREEGFAVEDALIQAGRTRLRPILMTTLTTILGLFPTALGIGGNVEMMQSMSVVVIGGLSFSTLITLFLIPTVYLMAHQLGRRRPPNPFGAAGKRMGSFFSSLRGRLAAVGEEEDGK